MSPAELLTRFMLALCVWREARGESMRGKALVAQVIRNRVDDPRWPDTYVGVITQRWQFSAFNPTDPNATLFPQEHDPSWAESVEASEAVLASPKTATDANHYHVLGLHPKWASDDAIVAREGAHVFYRL